MGYTAVRRKSADDNAAGKIDNVLRFAIPKVSQYSIISVNVINHKVNSEKTDTVNFSQATVSVISRRTCNRKKSYAGRLTESMVCAGIFPNGGIDTCQGGARFN